MSRMVPFNRNKQSLRPRGFEDFYHVLDDFFSEAWSPRSLARDTFKIDVQEHDKGYYIEAELPGVEKDEIHLEMMEGRLTIAVNREENREEEEKHFIHRERRRTSMQRSIHLKDARNQDIKAKLDQGILKINIPKEDQAANTITIDVE